MNRFIAMSVKPRMLDALSSARKVLWIFGLYHGKRLAKYPPFDIIRAGIVAKTTVFPALILTKILLRQTESAVIGSSSYFFCAVAWVMFRTYLHIANLPKMRALEDLLENYIFNMQNERQNRFVAAVKMKQKYVIRGYLATATVAMLFFVLYPMVSKKFLNIPIWTPLDEDKENVVTYIFESCYFAIQCILYPTMDCIFIGFTSIVTAQIEILKDNLEHATDRDPEDDSSKQESEIRERLRTCIIHHNAILDLTRKLEELFSPALFCQIVFAVLEVCFGGMQVVVETDPVQVLFWAVCLISVIGEVMISCWCGQEIITESSGIIEACYMSEWYICTPSSRKMLFIIMEQTKRPITLNGGYFFTLSFDIFLKVLRSAYSYYAVFRRIYQK